MSRLAEALALAIVDIDQSQASDADEDVKVLESLAHILQDASGPEKRSLITSFANIGHSEYVAGLGLEEAQDN